MDLFLTTALVVLLAAWSLSLHRDEQRVEREHQTLLRHLGGAS